MIPIEIVLQEGSNQVKYRALSSSARYRKRQITLTRVFWYLFCICAPHKQYIYTTHVLTNEVRGSATATLVERKSLNLLTRPRFIGKRFLLVLE